MNRSGAPTTYKRITPDRGCGFILNRIWDLTEDTTNTFPPSLPAGPHPTKQDIYRGTKWANRPGFASLLWSSLVADGLIESDDGSMEYRPLRRGFHHYSIGTMFERAGGHYEAGNGYTVRYHLTPKGRDILIDMMERRVLQKAAKQAFCERNGIEFGTGKTVAAPKKEEWREDDFLEPGETKEEWMVRNGVTPPPTPVERDILEKEALDCAKLAADYAGENQKLRAEKSNTNERLKKLYGRLIVLETTIHELQDEVAALAWDK